MSDERFVTIGVKEATKKYDTVKSDTLTYINTYRPVTVDFGMSCAAVTLSGSELTATSLYFISASAATTVYPPDTTGKVFVAINKSGQSLTFKSSAGAASALVTNDTASLLCHDGTDYKVVTSGDIS